MMITAGARRANVPTSHRLSSIVTPDFQDRNIDDIFTGTGAYCIEMHNAWHDTYVGVLSAVS